MLLNFFVFREQEEKMERERIEREAYEAEQRRLEEEKYVIYELDSPSLTKMTLNSEIFAALKVESEQIKFRVCYQN
jgi:hypothetical protein